MVFDPSGTWLNQWNHQFAALEIPHLRSPAIHQPDPDPHALRTFAASHFNELCPPYDLPGTQLFQDFCQKVIRRWQLQNCDLFLMGGLAVLRVGPTARNLSGARAASDRIVPALTKASLALS